MKKYILILFIFISSALLSYEGFLQAKISYYRPTNKQTRDIFKDGVLYGLEGTLQGIGGFYPWVSVSALPMKGTSIGLNSKTKLIMVPVGIGLKYIHTIQSSNIYVGAGILPAYIHVHDFAPFAEPKMSQWSVGGIFKGGLIMFLSSWAFLDVFVDYSLISFHFPNSEFLMGRKANLDGLSVGGSLGIKF